MRCTRNKVGLCLIQAIPHFLTVDNALGTGWEARPRMNDYTTRRCGIECSAVEPQGSIDKDIKNQYVNKNNNNYHYLMR